MRTEYAPSTAKASDGSTLKSSSIVRSARPSHWPTIDPGAASALMPCISSVLPEPVCPIASSSPFAPRTTAATSGWTMEDATAAGPTSGP